MAKIALFQGVSLDNLPAVQVINPYRDQVKKNFANLVCDYFELSLRESGDFESFSLPIASVIKDICNILELSEEEAEQFTGCVEVEFVAVEC